MPLTHCRTARMVPDGQIWPLVARAGYDRRCHELSRVWEERVLTGLVFGWFSLHGLVWVTCSLRWSWRLRRLLTTAFFFQAEDGIRDYKVTGVQTCALPI